MSFKRKIDFLQRENESLRTKMAQLESYVSQLEQQQLVVQVPADDQPDASAIPKRKRSSVQEFEPKPETKLLPTVCLNLVQI